MTKAVFRGICLLFALNMAAATAQTANSPKSNVENPVPFFVPGNAIQISSFPDTGAFVNGIYEIDDQGYIFLPKAGMVSVLKMSEAEFLKFLKETFVEYLRYPNLQVRPMIRLTFRGGFVQPRPLWADPRWGLWATISRAGGIKHIDGIKQVRWERDGKILSRELRRQYDSDVSLLAMGVKSGDEFWANDRPHKDGWEIFRDDVLPVLSFATSALVSTVSVYLAYQATKAR